jgi:RNA polymerase sigma-70 factor (ECF subfamily)
LNAEDPRDLDDHLFRREAGRMVAALTRIFGVHNLALAEDVVQDAFVRALEVWRLRGVPENPAAWLMAAAKNRALDVLRRERTARTYAPDMGRLLETEWTLSPAVNEAFEVHTIRDEQLRMMFSCCHPRLADDARVALILNILCGFSAGEIAAAFLTGRAAVEKRIARGKKVLAASKRLFDLADADFSPRLATVHRALYLLFNEGYHGSSPELAVRADLCAEAIRLIMLLREYQPADTPATNALAALMHLHAARLTTRVNAEGELSRLLDQDRSRWDARLIDEGLALFDRSATGDELTSFHLEAAIAVEHVRAASIVETRWETIVALYDRLMALDPSPVVALNRAIAIGERGGPAAGLAALNAIENRERLAEYPFYHAAVAELALRVGRGTDAREHFAAAIRLARNPMERRFLERRVRQCDTVDTGHETRDTR